ncbi:MAG: hypothetical protein GY716_13600 [bacterium]|nr:hypothetical protein [bacterium]
MGFSTGTLALGDFRLGLQMLRGNRTIAVELSALRDYELQALVDGLDDLDLSQFSYVSVHAPSRFVELSEVQAVGLLEAVFRRDWPVVLHPDAVQDWSLWRDHGSLVCIENMDKRKPIGRTAAELTEIYDHLPDASLCFDIGHARQVDPTMFEARAILTTHGHRLKQMHVSDVNSASVHEPLNQVAEWAFSRVAHLIPAHVPIIMETPVPEERLQAEMRRAQRALFPH